MICILYVIAVSGLLGLTAQLVDRVLPPGMTRRWLWLSVVILSILLPATYQAKHKLVVSTSVEGEPTVWAQISTFDPLLMRIWIAASLALLVWGTLHAVHVARLSRRRAETTEVDGVRVVVTESLGPATVGTLRPRVIIPRWVLALPEVERRYVLVHEDEHRRANDARMLLLTSLLLVIVPWNLALWWVLRRLSLAIEIDCDQRVVRKLGDERTYSELLLKIAQATNGSPCIQPAFLGAGSLERRLRAMLAPAQLSRAMRYALPAIAIVVLFVVLSTPHPVPSRHVAASTGHVHE